MFRITRGPSSGSFLQCLAKITVMVLSCPFDVDVVSVMAAYFPVVRVCTAQYRVAHSRLPLDCAVHTHTLQTVQYTHAHSRLCSTHTHHGQIYCHNSDYVHINGHDRTITVILAKHSVKLPDDGPLVIRNMLEQF